MAPSRAAVAATAAEAAAATFLLLRNNCCVLPLSAATLVDTEMQKCRNVFACLLQYMPRVLAPAPAASCSCLTWVGGWVMSVGGARAAREAVGWEDSVAVGRVAGEAVGWAGYVAVGRAVGCTCLRIKAKRR